MNGMNGMIDGSLILFHQNVVVFLGFNFIIAVTKLKMFYSP